MMWLRAALFNAVMLGSGLVLSLYGQIILRISRRHLFGVGQAWARLTLLALRMICGIRLEVENAASLPTGPALIAAQHQSMFDIMVWLILLPHPAYVMKHELLKIPVFGSLLVPAGLIAIDRKGGAASLRTMVAQCRAAIAAGRQIVIFPEGTRVPPGQRASIQPGIVALARALDVELYPAATDSGRYWGAKALRKNPGIARVKIYPPLPKTLSREDMLARLARHFYEDGVADRSAGR